jgi:hypothetical protein
MWKLSLTLKASVINWWSNYWASKLPNLPMHPPFLSLSLAKRLRLPLFRHHPQSTVKPRYSATLDQLRWTNSGAISGVDSTFVSDLFCLIPLWKYWTFNSCVSTLIFRHRNVYVYWIQCVTQCINYFRVRHSAVTYIQSNEQKVALAVLSSIWLYSTALIFRFPCDLCLQSVSQSQTKKTF